MVISGWIADKNTKLTSTYVGATHAATHSPCNRVSWHIDIMYVRLCFRVLSSIYDSFRWNCYTPEILQIQKTKFLGANPKSTKIPIWICTARYREILVSEFGGSLGCINFSGKCLTIYICLSLSLSNETYIHDIKMMANKNSEFDDE